MEERKGNLYIVVASVLFSVGGLCVKMIPWNPVAINGSRCLISCCIMCLYLYLTKQPLRVNRSTLLGALCIVSTNLLFIMANKMTTAANAILLQFTAPIFVVLLMFLFFKEKPKKLDIYVSLFVFAGIVCFFLDGLQRGKIMGDILALTSGLTYAGVFMMSRLKGGDPFSSTFMGQVAGGLIGLPFLVQETNFSGSVLFYVIILGVFQLGLGYICFCNGIKRTKPLTSALISGVEPVLNPVWVAIFVGEFISPISALGGILVLGAVMVYNVILARKEPVVEGSDLAEVLEEISQRASLSEPADEP